MTHSTPSGAQALAERGRRPRVLVVPGEDAAAEAMEATVHVLQTVVSSVTWDVLPSMSSSNISAKGYEDSVRAGSLDSPAVLFGAARDDDSGLEFLRWGRATYANVRPIRWYPGVASPLHTPIDIDYALVRENLEDLYIQAEGALDDVEAWLLARDNGRLPARWPGKSDPQKKSSVPHDDRYALKVATRQGVEKVAEFACQLAERRAEAGVGKGTVTCTAKWNVLPQTDGLFRDTVREVVSAHDRLRYSELLIDTFAARMVSRPQDLDVVVIPNLYGDILSDAAAATVGGLGLCPSGVYGDSFAYFEPIHGTAPDIAGKHVVNPTASLLSAAMLLDFLGLKNESATIENAVTGVLGAGVCLTPDLDGDASTEEFCERVIYWATH